MKKLCKIPKIDFPVIKKLEEIEEFSNAELNEFSENRYAEFENKDAEKSC